MAIRFKAHVKTEVSLSVWKEIKAWSSFAKAGGSSSLEIFGSGNQPEHKCQEPSSSCEARKKKTLPMGNVSKVSKGAAASSIKRALLDLHRSSPGSGSCQTADKDGEQDHHSRRASASHGIGAGLLGYPPI
ncbi:hypothetical protein EK904_004770, partial [Melospiza melodia maxima]